MAHLPIEAKKAIMAQVLSRGSKAIHEIARENNVGYSTVQKWLKREREGNPLQTERYRQQPGNHGQTSPLEHILATKGLDEQAIGAYCRSHGIHSFQLQQWRDELMKHNGNKEVKAKESAETKALRNEINALKKELRRKDKALAETTALLVLKKKADLIWGEFEDD